MSDTVQVVFDTLKIKPNQEFYIDKNEKRRIKQYVYYLDENLRLFAQIEGYNYLCDMDSILKILSGFWKVKPL